MSKIYGYAWEIEEETSCKKGGNVYFIRDGMGNIKIGIAKDVLRRKKELQTSNPNELEIFYVMHVPKMWDAQEIERDLHESFSEYRKKGEWFIENPIIEWLRNGEIVAGGFRFQNADW